ncbi:MAG: ATP-binding cassette domain-containing protein, partial [Ferrimonas sp.]
LATIRQFNRLEAEAEQMDRASDLFRQRTMAVLKMAFLSSAVLEFFASVSIAIIAVYFGFSYLGELNFGHYGYGVSLFSGLLVLFLAPEFFQPFRDLGTYYHAKAEAIGAADALQQFLQTPTPTAQFAATTDIAQHGAVTLVAKQLIATTTQGEPLTEAVSFTLEADQSLAISGVTGSGKTSILQVLMGALPYQGSVTLNGQELRTIAPQELLKQITWLGQNPMLFADTIAANLRLAAPEASDAQLWQALEQAYAKEFVEKLPAQLNYPLNDQGAGLSVGQAQRIALARALLKPAPLLLLDEPTASLDRNSEQLVQQALSQFIQGRTCILVSHRATQLAEAQQQLSLHTLQEV